MIVGNPDQAHISTSLIERQNLTMRMSMRRFTRLTNAFSKKIENLRAAVSLHFAHYNFVRVHRSLRVTPAIGARVTKRVAGRVRRRAALELGLCLALALRLTLAQTDAARERPREGGLLVAVGTVATPVPLKLDDLPLDGKETLAWPMDPATNRCSLHLQAPTRAEGQRASGYRSGSR